MNIAAALLKNIMAQNLSLPALRFRYTIFFVGAIIQWLSATAGMPYQGWEAFPATANMPYQCWEAFPAIANIPYQCWEAFPAIANMPYQRWEAFPAIAGNPSQHYNQIVIDKIFS